MTNIIVLLIIGINFLANANTQCEGHKLDSIKYESSWGDHELITNYSLSICPNKLDETKMKEKLEECEDRSIFENVILSELNSDSNKHWQFKMFKSVKLEECTLIRINSEKYYLIKYLIDAELKEIFAGSTYKHGYWFGKYGFDESQLEKDYQSLLSDKVNSFPYSILRKSTCDTSYYKILKNNIYSTKTNKYLTSYNVINFDTEADSRWIINGILTTDIDNDKSYDFVFNVETIAATMIGIYKIRNGAWNYDQFLASDPN